MPALMLKDEVAIITGAGMGIGRSAALQFASEGAKVVACDIEEELVRAVVLQIIAEGGQAIAVVGDVTAEDFPKKVITTTVQKYGKINHIVNNAGFPLRYPLKDMPDEAFDLMMNLHVRSPFRLIREAAPYFCFDGSNKENRSIVNVSSVVGLHGDVLCANYAAAKSAVIGFTKTIAKEWGPFGVRANVAAFGMIMTRLSSATVDDAEINVDGKNLTLKLIQPASVLDGLAAQTPLRRGGTAEESASAVLFLCSPLASFVTGHVLEVTGGLGI